MDKYEYKVRSQEIRNLIAQGEYAQAAEIADTIDWRRVKSVMMLCTISDLYKINRRFEESKELLLLAYERHPGGRTIVYSLCELSIKMGEFVQAIEYYKEFVQIAPKDTGRYILQYKLYVAQEVSLEERIEVLEELKKRDYREKWAYELAYLYHRVGLATRCVEECDELILWFGEGKYVTKAMELKMLHQPLTPEQQAKYEGRFEEYRLEQEAAQNATTLPVDEDNPMDVMSAPTVEISGGELDDIQVKTMDVGEYNTINLQKELADSMKDLWEGTPGEQQPSVVTEEYFSDEDLSKTQQITRAIVAPLFQDTDDMTEIAYQVAEEPGEEQDETPTQEAVNEVPGTEGTEVMETAEGEEADDIDTLAVAGTPDEAEAQPEESKETEEIQDEVQDETESEDEPEEKPEEKPEDETARQVLAQMQMEITSGETLKRPPAFDKYLGMEYDGQISFVVPESENVEKQITGQLNIDDILAEWERMKKENEEKCAEEVRQRVLQHTGNILIDFDQAVKEGLLEKLENSDETDLPEEEMQEEVAETEPEEAVEKAESEVVTEAEEAEEPEEAVQEVEPAGEPETEEPEEVVQEVEPAGKPETEEPVDYGETEELEEIEEVTEEIKEAEESEEAPAEASNEEAEAVEEAEEKEETGKTPAKEGKEVVTEGEILRDLTREEKELYAAFIQNRKSKEQLIKAIDTISLAAYTGNVIITGEEGMDTLTLAKNLMKELQMTDSNFSGKIAKISGSAMNQREPEKILEKLDNGALIVEHAGGMNAQTAERLYKTLQQENKGIVVILEGTRKSVNKLLDTVPALKECFNARVNIEALDNDSLVAFGKKYAKEQEYSIDEMGLLALHTKISDRQTSDHAVTLLEVKEMMDDAIDHANRKTLGHFFDILFAKRYDEEDMIILRENDFI